MLFQISVPIKKSFKGNAAKFTGLPFISTPCTVDSAFCAAKESKIHGNHVRYPWNNHVNSNDVHIEDFLNYFSLCSSKFIACITYSCLFKLPFYS